MTCLPWLDGHGGPAFPPPSIALRDPDGLLAAGGSLAPDWLLTAYRQGIFPWFDEQSPILWWSPDPRMVLWPGRMHVSRRLRRRLRRPDYRVTLDRAFPAVIKACADPGLRRDQESTWVTPQMQRAYTRLAELGHAHSVEVWQEERLVGGLYGLAIGRAFFGESMFSRVADASKIAMAWLDESLTDWGYRIMDCQVESDHLRRMGAVAVNRRVFLDHLAEATATPPAPRAWDELLAPGLIRAGRSA